MNLLPLEIFIPIVLSLFCFIFKKAAGWIALLASAAMLALAGYGFNLASFSFSSGIYLAAAFFTFLIVVYSFKFMEGKERLSEYYGFILITLGSTAGVVFATDYLILMLYWGLLAFTLYMLIGIGGPNAGAAAKKSFIIVGGADALMIMGIGIIIALTGSTIIGADRVVFNNIYSVIAFLCLAAGVAAKVGAIPLHSWVPDSALEAPASIMAYLPASLDKLLGIYLLTRLCLDVFVIEPNSAMSIFLMLMGSISIMVAVIAALVQHDLKKLLSFHAVSQVGYMILGIGTGIPVAIAGGIFHMFNNAIYKSLLFMAGGNIEKQTGTTELSELGGLSKAMPITFICVLIGALSISGVPPFNGFMSKWMIYQGIVELSQTSPYWIIWLLAAMFGSALTLASFVKIIHAVFLGQGSEYSARAKEVSWMMWLPIVVLASLCVVFGVFAYELPIKYFIMPAIGPILYSGFWSPVPATVLIVISLLIGLASYYLVGRKRSITRKPSYIGGELLDEKTIKVSGTEFYNTIREYGPLPYIINIAEKKALDIYELGKNLFSWSSGLLSRLHNGFLQTYLAWMLLGIGLLFFILTR